MNFEKDFGNLSLENNPLGFTKAINSHCIPTNNDLSENPPQQQIIIDFFVNKNSNNLKESELLTEVDVKDLLKSINKNLFNTKLQYSEVDSDYITSKPLTHIPIEQFNHFISTYQQNDLISLEQEISNKSTVGNLKNIIGPFSPLDQLIELTYKFNFGAVQEMLRKRVCFSRKIFKWRKIKGDGNCFYRAIIFSFIESIILENNQELFINLIFDIKSCYENPLILSKLLVTNGNVINYKLAMKILIIISKYLYQGNIEKAYEIYIKCMLSCLHFDYALVMYIRFILYRYIKDNKTKLYTKEFPVVLGNLLPSEYETEDGTFLFEQFYENYLLKMFKDAEKIVIYLIPFVLCTQLNIEMFDMQEDSLKQFNYYGKKNPNGDFTIDIVNNRVHYELIYTEEKYNLHRKIFELYKMSQEYINIVMPPPTNTNTNDLMPLTTSITEQQPPEQSQKEQQEMQFFSFPINQQDNNNQTNNNSNSNINNQGNTQCNSYGINMNNNISLVKSIPVPESTSMFDYFTSKKAQQSMNNVGNKQNELFGQPQNNQCQSQILYQPQSLLQEQKQHELFNSSPINQLAPPQNINKTTTTPNTIQQSQVFPICMLCKGNYLEKNEYDICKKCLLEEIRTNFLVSYFKFLPASKRSVEISKKPEIALEMFLSTFKTKKIIIQNKELSVEDAKFFINSNCHENLSIYDILYNFKKTICVACENNINSSLVKLPCGCCLCTAFCCSNFFKQYNLITNKDYICVCGKTCELDHLLQLAMIIAPYNKGRADEIFSLFQKKISNKCFKCIKDIRHSNDLIIVKCKGMPKNFSQHFGDVTITHAVCSACAYLHENQPNTLCSICHSYHSITQDKGCLYH